jgi:CRP-like cAMP-binding protein
VVPNSVVTVLSNFNPISLEAAQDLEALTAKKTSVLRHDELPPFEGNERQVWVLLEGWACRYMTLPNGDRQIVGLMTAGDFSDTRSIRLASSNIGIMAMTDVSIAFIQRDRFNELLDRHRDVVMAVAKAHLADESIMRTWIANMARKPAKQRMAHLLCEMVSRVSRVTPSLRMVIKLPFIQTDMADLLGISPVHVNRILQALRTEGLIHLRSKWLEISNYDALSALAEFDPGYLYYDEHISRAA